MWIFERRWNDWRGARDGRLQCQSRNSTDRRPDRPIRGGWLDKRCQRQMAMGSHSLGQNPALVGKWQGFRDYVFWQYPKIRLDYNCREREIEVQDIRGVDP